MFNYFPCIMVLFGHFERDVESVNKVCWTFLPLCACFSKCVFA